MLLLSLITRIWWIAFVDPTLTSTKDLIESKLFLSSVIIDVDNPDGIFEESDW